MAQLRTRTRKKSTVAKTISSANKKVVPVDKSRMSSLLNKISDDMVLQEVLKKRIKENMEKLEGLMESSDIRLYETTKGKGEIITPPTRASNTIDVVKFFKKVSRDEFFETVTVPLGGAKKVLSEKELDKITIEGRTAQKPDVLKVTPK